MALDDYNYSIELDSENMEAYECRAKLYRKLGKITEAEADEKMATGLKEK